jgi:hypothetical protein
MSGRHSSTPQPSHPPRPPRRSLRARLRALLRRLLEDDASLLQTIAALLIAALTLLLLGAYAFGLAESLKR